MNHLRVLAVIAVLALTSSAFPEETSRRVGRLTVAIDESSSYPGGLVTVRLRSAPRYGVVNAILEGRRCPFLPSHRGLRALVPVPVDATPGPTTLGIEVRAGNGRQRFALPITVAERSYPPRSVLLPEVKKAMLTSPRGVPIWGEYHRGLDYLVPAGTPVSSPAAGTVLFAGPLLLTGETVVLDHGQGLVSVFYHLASTPVREGDWVEAGAPLGLTGETGIAAVPHLHWGVYVHGVAVDPHVTERCAD